MADETKPAIGMSVGATTLAAVTAERAVTRRPVLTLYPDRSPQVGVPADNPNMTPDLGESGLTITDFVDQVGAQAAVLAPDGSAHRGEQLLADGLYALAYDAIEGRPLPPAVAVAHPAHWSATSVDALRAALARVPEWSQHPVLLLSDAAAALTALQANPGLPADGIIAVCDFGGSGTSVTFVDAASACQPIDSTVRYTGFSGDLIDQALLDHVVADLTAERSVGDKSTIGSLARLRSQCRNAKEQLSTSTVTELPVDFPGFHGGVWVTRAELDEAIRQPFDGFLAAVQKSLGSNNIQLADLTAVVAVGGGANIPAVTTGLSERLEVTVISSPRPQLTAAIGAALGVSGGPSTTAETTTMTAEVVGVPDTPEVEKAPQSPAPVQPIEPVQSVLAPIEMASPAAETEPAVAPQPTEIPEPPDVEGESLPADADRLPGIWSRRSTLVILITAVAVLVMGVVAIIVLRRAADNEPMTPTVTSESVVTTAEVPPPPATATPMPTEEPTVPPEIPATPTASEIPEPETVP